MLTAADLASMRSDAASILIDTCTIKFTTGSPRVLTTIASNVPCDVIPDHIRDMPSSSAEVNMGIVHFTLSLPYNTTIGKDYQVDHAGHSYKVVELLDDHTPLIVKRVRMERISS